MTKSKKQIEKIKLITEQNLEAFIGDDKPVPGRWKLWGVMFVTKKKTTYRFIRKDNMWAMYEKHKALFV
jgi:hypothetical protein